MQYELLFELLLFELLTCSVLHGDMRAHSREGLFTWMEKELSLLQKNASSIPTGEARPASSFIQ